MTDKNFTSNYDVCDKCGTKLIEDCLRCGSPNCCPKCCKEAQQEINVNERNIMPKEDEKVLGVYIRLECNEKHRKVSRIECVKPGNQPFFDYMDGLIACKKCKGDGYYDKLITIEELKRLIHGFSLEPSKKERSYNGQGKF